jgi:pimeloyl-ACP methyl ester carboxylesterase
MSRRAPRVPGFALLAAVALGACSGGEQVSVTSGDGLRFERLVPAAGAKLAALEPYPTRNGQGLMVRRYGARSPWGVVLLHGSGYHGAYLAGLAGALADGASVQVFTPDLRGHGPDPERRGDTDYVDQLEDDVADLIAWMGEQHGVEQVLVGGHSSGGGLAVRFAGSRHGETATGYFLLAPYLGHDAPTARPDSGGWARPRVGRIVALGILNGFGVRLWNDASVIEFAMPEAVRDGSETLAYSYRLNTGYAPRDYAKDLAAVPRPWLGLIGSEDEAFLPDALAPTLTAHAQAEVFVLDGVGHLDLSTSPETADRLVRWIDRLRGS